MDIGTLYVDSSANTVTATEYLDSTPVFFHACNSASDSITSSGFKTVEFNSEEFDYGSNFNTVSDRFYAPTTGVYQLNAVVTASGIDVGDWICVYLYKNGVQYKRLESRNSGDSFQYQIIGGSATVQLNAGDYMHVRFYSSEGSTFIIEGGSEYTYFSGHRIN